MVAKTGSGAKGLPANSPVETHAAAPGAGEDAPATGTKNAIDPASLGAFKVVQLDSESKATLGIPYAPFKAQIVDVDVRSFRSLDTLEVGE